MTDLPTRPILAIALTALLAATPVLAQEAREEAAEGATDETSEAAEAVNELASETLSTGETPAQSQPANTGPQIYVREEHGDWEIRCLENPGDGPDPCQMFQRLQDQNGNPTADVNVFDLPDGGSIVAGVTVLTPLQTLLTAQLSMQIDSGETRLYPFAFCDTAGCYSRIGLTADDLARLRRGAKATLIVVPAQAPDQKAELTMSLTGFTAGYAAVEVPNQ